MIQKVFQKEMVARPKSGRGTGRFVLEMSAPKSSPSKGARGNDSDDEDQDGEEDEASIGNILIKRCPRAEYFLDPYGQYPRVPEESGVRGIIYPAAPLRKKRFIGSELSKLRQLVRQQNQQFLYSQLYTRTMAHGDSMTPQHLDQFEAEKRRIANLTDFELEKDPSHIDWEAIQAASFPNRTPNELETEWRLFCDPNYIRGPWTAEEDQSLLRAAQAHHERHWDRIAQDLGNKRLPVQYLSRYQQSLRPKNVPDARETTSRSYSVKTGAHKAKLTRGTAGFQLALEGASKVSKRTKKQHQQTLQQQLMDEVMISSQPEDEASTPSSTTATTATNTSTNAIATSTYTTTTSPSRPSSASAAASAAAPSTANEEEEQHRDGEEEHIDNEDEEEEEEEVIVTAKSGFKWTPDEDELLTEAVKKFGDKNWTAVASMLGSLRTGQQCLHRWQKTLNPTIRRGRWEQEEDNLLAMAVRAYGAGNWRLIQKHVPGRTDVQCRERWVNILDPSVKGSEGWTAAEDAYLMEIVASQPQGKWSLVAKFHNEGMIAQYQKLISTASSNSSSSSSSSDASTNQLRNASSSSSAMDVDIPPSSSSSSSSSTTTSSLQENHGTARPNDARRQSRSAPAPIVATPVKPPTRTDNQCWRRWKVLHKVVSKKTGAPGGNGASSSVVSGGVVDIEALASQPDESASTVGSSSSQMPSPSAQGIDVAGSTAAPSQRNRATSTASSRRSVPSSSATPAAKPSSSSPSSSIASPSTPRQSPAPNHAKSSSSKKTMSSSSSKKRGRKVPDWMRDDYSDYDNDDDEDAVVMPKRKKQAKVSAGVVDDQTSPEPSSDAPLSSPAPPTKRPTRNAAKAAAVAMTAASTKSPLAQEEDDEEVALAPPKRNFSISIVSSLSEPPTSSSPPSEIPGFPTIIAVEGNHSQEEGGTRATRRLKLKITKRHSSS